MAKVNVDWNNLGFAYQPISQRYVANFKDGKWGEGHLTDDANVTINECAGILQYCQEVFEGLKAYKTKDGRVVTFRPDMNAKRMIDSAKRLEMPPVSEEMFLEAVDQVVAANKDWIPPFESGGALYLRPYLFATGPVIGVKPSDEYQFRLFGTPVGSYFKNGVKPITVCVSDYDRAAPHGTGNIKAGLNYAMSLYPYILAHQKGFDENMYLDAATRTYVEETGGANFLFVTKDGKLVTELKDFAEAGLCGTAAVICPVGKVVGNGETIEFPSGMKEMGPVLTKLYNTLRGIQLGTVEAPEEGWIREIK